MEKGDRVKLKGRDPEGYISTMDKESHWVCVNWDKQGPKYVHEFELEVI